MGITSYMRNRYLLVLLIMALASCTSTKKTTVHTAATVVQPAAVDTSFKKAPVTETVDTVMPTYRIGLLLPLMLDAHFNTSTDSIQDNQGIITQALPYLHFLEGALLEKDSLLKQHIIINYRIFDTSLDSLNLSRLLDPDHFGDCDAVIASLPANFYSQAGKVSRAIGKPVYILQASNTQVLDSFPGLWLAQPSNVTQLKMMSRYLVSSFPGALYTTIYRDQRKENELAGIVATEIDSTAGKNETCKKINYSKADGWSKFTAQLSKQKKNIVFIATTDEAWLSSMLNKIDELDGDYPIELCGLPNWENFETIDPAKWKKFRTIIFNTTFIDYNNSGVNIFRKNFINQYHTDPLYQAYLAGDLIQFIALNQKKNGSRYDKYRSQGSLLFPSTGYTFKKLCNGCGFENQSLHIMRFDDYKLVPLH